MIDLYRFAAVLFCVVGTASSVPNSETLSNILQSGISDHVYPGIAAIAGSASGKYVFSGAFGNYKYLNEDSNSPAVDLDKSIFDIASVSKVIATTSAVALLYQRGYLSVEDLISKHLPHSNYAQNGKENVKVLHCLLHNAGYQGDPNPPYYSPEFACPNAPQSSHTSLKEDPPLDFSCINQVYNNFLQESLVTPPGEAYVYSDLSFITLQFIVGSIVYENKLLPPSSLREECSTLDMNNIKDNYGLLYNCYFEAFVRTAVFEEKKGWLPSTSYLPAAEKYDMILPTVNQTQGHVSDSNCYAMGGVCGHAGVFSTAPDLARVLTRLLNLAAGGRDTSASTGSTETSTTAEAQDRGHGQWLNASTVQYFVKEYNGTQSSRALGWNTNDPNVNDFGFSGSCGNMSSRTFMHIGYTGTCVCVDPVNGLWSVILTNRVWGMGSSDAVKSVYRAFHNEVLAQWLSDEDETKDS